MNVAIFFGAVSRYWRLFTAVVAVCVALAVAASVATPTEYVSSTRLLVTLNGSTTATAYENDDVVSGRVNSYVALMTSDAVTQRVVDKLGLNESADEFATKVNATIVPPRTSLIDVAVSDTSPEQATLLADTLADEFIVYTNTLETPTGVDGQRVQTSVVSTASIPHERLPGRWLLGVLGLLAGVVAASVAVWIRSRTDPVLRTPDRAAEVAGVPVIGSVVATPTNAREREGYLRLRARLRLTRPGSDTSPGDCQIWMIACVAGEENTDAFAVAMSLGQAMSRDGAGAIVIHTQPRASDQDGVPGLFDVLLGAAPIDQAIHVRRNALPDLMSAGSRTDSSEELLASTVMDRVLVDLRSRYRNVILDAGSLLSNPTASSLAECVDGGLIVIRLGTTRRRDLVQAVARLRDVATSVTGVVVCTGSEVDSRATDLDRAHQHDETGPPHHSRSIVGGNSKSVHR